MNARPLASAGAALAGLGALYAFALLLGMPDPAWSYLARGVVHLGELAVLLAVAVSGAAGSGLLARVGVGLAVLGQLALAVAEWTLLAAPDLSMALFAVGPNLTGLGLVLTGIAVVRTGVLTGWRRWTVLALGAYVFLVMTPAIIVSGGPPAPLGLWALAVWGLLWVLIAVSVLAGTTAVRRAGAPTAA